MGTRNQEAEEGASEGEEMEEAALGMLVGLGQNNFPSDRMTFL